MMEIDLFNPEDIKSPCSLKSPILLIYITI